MSKKILTPDGEIVDAEPSQKVFFKTPYNHNTDAESARVGLLCEEPTKTQQHQAEEADINTIVRRFGVTGTLPQVNVPPTYGDFAGAETYQEQMNVIAQANSSFYGLPAEIRSKFANNPGIYTTYVNDALEKGDLKALNEMGLELNERPGEPPKLGVTPPNPSPPPADAKGA